jgi:hypothetical protein
LGDGGYITTVFPTELAFIVPAPSGCAVRDGEIDPADLEAAQAEDAVMHAMEPVDRVLLAPNAA